MQSTNVSHGVVLGIILGILLILINRNRKHRKQEEAASKAEPVVMEASAEKEAVQPGADVENRIEQLFALKEKGALTEDEYQQRKSEILGTVAPPTSVESKGKPEKTKKEPTKVQKALAFVVVVFVLIAVVNALSDDKDDKTSAPASTSVPQSIASSGSGTVKFDLNTGEQVAQKPAAKSESTSNKEWYQGGTLHNATVNEWRGAIYENKLATCADWVASMARGASGKLKSVKTTEDLMGYSVALIAFLDEAVRDVPDIGNQKINQFVAIGAVMMEW